VCDVTITRGKHEHEEITFHVLLKHHFVVLNQQVLVHICLLFESAELSVLLKLPCDLDKIKHSNILDPV